MNTSISLCMIVMDEEEHLRECLESVRGIVDEIIVVDTGSQDNTVSIAQSFGARVLFHKWKEDFSISRNISLEHATGDWILILDADEVLAEESRDTVRALTLNKDVPGYLVHIQKYHEWTGIIGLRLFQNSLSLRFRGIFNEILTVPEHIYSQLVLSDIKIIHKDWCEEDFKRKSARNISLLKKHISLYPEDIYQILDLVMIYLKTEKLSEAEELLGRVLLLLPQKKHDKRNYNRYQILYYYYKLQLLYKKRADFESRRSLCEKALSVSKANPLFLYEAAKIYYRLKEYNKAIEFFQQCLALGESSDFDRSVVFPREILGASSLEGVGFCFFKMHKYKESARSFEKSYMLKKNEKVKIMLDASRCLMKKQEKVKTPF